MSLGLNLSFLRVFVRTFPFVRVRVSVMCALTTVFVFVHARVSV